MQKLTVCLTDSRKVAIVKSEATGETKNCYGCCTQYPQGTLGRVSFYTSSSPPEQAQGIFLPEVSWQMPPPAHSRDIVSIPDQGIVAPEAEKPQVLLPERKNKIKE